jgi:hypothetical protein
VQRRLFLSSFVDVAGYLGEAEELPRAVADGIDDDAGPEAAAVVADPPAFSLELAFVDRGFQRLGGNAVSAVFRGIEPGEMRADDFLRRIALEALGPGVPASDVAPGDSM